MQYMYHIMNTHSANMPAIDALRVEHHVWFIDPETVTDSLLLDAARRLLSPDETRRHARFRFARDRHRFLISHALVRQVLSRYWPIPPQDWVFSKGPHGKPDIVNPEIAGLRFNLTHTAGLAACIVTLDEDCGIDAECLRERTHLEGIARKMFSPAECTELGALSGRPYLERFFECWTLREAYVKARGIGIAYPTHKLHFSTDNERTISVEFHADIDDHGQNWRFELFKPTAEHIMATAINSQKPARKKIVLHRFKP